MKGYGEVAVELLTILT